MIIKKTHQIEGNSDLKERKSFSFNLPLIQENWCHFSLSFSVNSTLRFWGLLPHHPVTKSEIVGGQGHPPTELLWESLLWGFSLHMHCLIFAEKNEVWRNQKFFIKHWSSKGWVHAGAEPFGKGVVMYTVLLQAFQQYTLTPSLSKILKLPKEQNLFGGDRKKILA